MRNTNFYSFVTADEPALYLSILSRIWNVEVRAVAEIGVHTGRTSRLLRYNFPEAMLYLIDPWELYDEYKTKEAGPISHDANDYEKAYQLVKERFAKDPKVKILRTTSKQAAELIQEPLDLIFIDGNHAYDYVIEDIETWLPKVRPGGIVSGHDYDHERFPEVVRAVDEIFAGQNVALGSFYTWAVQKPISSS